MDETITYKGYNIKIEHDEFGYELNPTENGNYSIVQFRDNDWNTYEDIDEYLTENGKLLPSVQAKLRAGKMFTISYSRYSSTDGGFYGLDGSIPTGEVDSRDVNGFIIFEDDYIKGTSYEDRKRYAEGDLREYTSWANGEVYGYTITDEFGEEVEDGSLWGIIGYEWAEEEAKSFIDYLEKQPFKHQFKTAKKAQELHK